MIRRLAALTLSVLLAACAGPMASRPAAPVTVGIAAINDFHGTLEPPKQAVLVPDGRGGTVAVPAGGAAWLASALDAVRGKYANHLTVSAGDLISASPLASSLYLDEPAIGVMNRLGLDFNAVGNHEFDRGRAELLRMQNGGCAKHTAREPCRLETFAGARFAFLSASTTREDGTTLFPATGIKRFGRRRGKVAVGVIGLTLKGTPTLVSPDGVKGLTFGDEADAINAAVPGLKAQGADAVVVLVHQGGRTAPGGDPNSCQDLAGDIRPILDRLAPGVDVVVSGHTHAAYVCDYAVGGRSILLTSAGLYGELVTDIALEIDPAAHRVVGRQARNVVVQSAPFTSARGPVANSDLVPRFDPRADVAAYVGRYIEAAKAFAQRPVGKLSGAAEKVPGPLGGVLGNLVADAQLAATRGAGARIALTNPFGLRAALVPETDGAIAFGALYAAQPFGNQLITQTLTGAELKSVLEQGFADTGPEQFLSPSAGFSYAVDRAAPAGSRVSGMALDGKPIDPAARYRVTTNSFLANGGDGFTALATQREAVVGMDDLVALEGWVAAVPVREVPQDLRVREAGR